MDLRRRDEIARRVEEAMLRYLTSNEAPKGAWEMTIGSLREITTRMQKEIRLAVNHTETMNFESEADAQPR